MEDYKEENYTVEIKAAPPWLLCNIQIIMLNVNLVTNFNARKGIDSRHIPRFIQLIVNIIHS
jgi:hypothetical protein